jgi:chromosome segregation protein
VDRRAIEAHRVLRFAELTVQQERQAAVVAAALAAQERAYRAYHSAEAAWHAIWAKCAVHPGPPTAMLAWMRHRDDALRLLEGERRAAEGVERAQGVLAAARKHLIEAAALLGTSFRPDEEFPTLRRQVREAHAAASTAWTDSQALAAAARELTERVARLESDLAHAIAEQARWREEWAAAVVRLHLSPAASFAEADAALSVWDAIGDRSTNRAQTTRRLEGLRRDVELFRSKVDALRPSFRTTGAARETTDPEIMVRMLHEGLREDQRRLDRQAELARRAENASKEHLEKLEGARAAAEQIDRLLRQYNLDAGCNVLAITAEAQERRRLIGELTEKRNELASAGDGIAENGLRGESGSISPDESSAELLALERDEERLVLESQAAAQAETQAESALTDLAGRKGAAEAAQEAQNACLEIGIHAERWMILEAARRILERAMERYRAANEHPLVRRASEIFGLIAGTGANPIERLTARYRDGDAPALVGIRQDGSSCEIDGMSEGTRDQLYLALRIASVERHAAENEPLPFLADDLFITSDDERIVPGLATLAELGRSTQVVLFTHHRHVLAAAFGTLPADAVKVHRLVGSTDLSAGVAAAG